VYILDGKGEERLVDEVNGVIYSILIKQHVIGVDMLVLIIAGLLNGTLIVIAHVDAWFGLVVIKKYATYCWRKLRAVRTPYASANP